MTIDEALEGMEPEYHLHYLMWMSGQWAACICRKGPNWQMVRFGYSDKPAEAIMEARAQHYTVEGLNAVPEYLQYLDAEGLGL